MQLFFIGIIFTVLTIGFLVKKRRSVYKYDVSNSYAYNFDCADKKIQVLKNGSFLQLDNVEIALCDTAILEVELHSSFFACLYQPYIEIEQSGKKLRHYFEYGARGKRYIDMSQNIACNEPIHFIEYRCGLTQSPLVLYVFNNHITYSESLCVIAPHPDDAEIAAFGLYSQFENTHMITISASESGRKMYDELGLDTQQQALLKGRTRTMNSLSVPTLGGVNGTKCLNYGYFGSTLKMMFENQNEIVTSKVKILNDMYVFRKMNIADTLLNPQYSASWNSLVNDLKYSLEKIQPEIIVLPYPRIDTHNDHKYTTYAVFEALKEMNYQKGKLFFYTNHHVLSEAYPFGRKGSAIDLPPNSSKSLYFDSLYSQSLDQRLQADKIVALEAMNVLRPYYPWQKKSTILNRVFKNQMNAFYGKWLDYYSRSVRSNELFFVVDVKNLFSGSLFKEL